MAAHQTLSSLGLSPGKSTGVGCHFLLQCMKVKSESEVAKSCLTLSDPMDCSLPGSSVHGIFQARVLEWGAIAFSDSSTLGVLKRFSYWRSPSRSLWPPPAWADQSLDLLHCCLPGFALLGAPAVGEGGDRGILHLLELEPPESRLFLSWTGISLRRSLRKGTWWWDDCQNRLLLGTVSILWVSVNVFILPSI